MNKKDTEETIDLIRDIISSIEDGSISLSTALTKSKRVYILTKNVELEEFVKLEIEGNFTDENIPDYRRKNAESVGEFRNRYTGQIDHVTLQYEEFLRRTEVDPKIIYTRLLPTSVPEMEDFLNKTETKELLLEYHPGLLALTKKYLESDSSNGWDLKTAYFRIDPSAFTQILIVTKNRFIELLLRIESNLKNSSVEYGEHFFENGSHFDAIFKFSETISKANKEIILIDGYVDEKTLRLFTKKEPQVILKILTDKKSISDNLSVFIENFNLQYKNLEVKSTKAFHDRFLLIDGTDFYHIGASIKDAGNKTFMYSLIEDDVIKDAVLGKFNSEWNK